MKKNLEVGDVVKFLVSREKINKDARGIIKRLMPKSTCGVVLFEILIPGKHAKGYLDLVYCSDREIEKVF